MIGFMWPLLLFCLTVTSCVTSLHTSITSSSIQPSVTTVWWPGRADVTNNDVTNSSTPKLTSTSLSSGPTSSITMATSSIVTSTRFANTSPATAVTLSAGTNSDLFSARVPAAASSIPSFSTITTHHAATGRPTSVSASEAPATTRNRSVYVTVGMTTGSNVSVSRPANVTNSSTPVKVTALSPYVTGTPLIIFSVIIGLVSLLGSVGNLVSMYVYYPRGKQGNVYVFFLSCIDLVMASVVMPLTSVLLAGLMNVIQLYFFAIALVFIVLQSICILVSISIDRYIACCHPQLYNNTQRYAKVIIALEIIFNIVAICVAFNRPIGSNIFNYLSRVIICGGFVLIVVLYVKIFIVLRRRMTSLGPDSGSSKQQYHQPIPSISEPCGPELLSDDISVQPPPSIASVRHQTIGVRLDTTQEAGDHVPTSATGDKRMSEGPGMSLSHVVSIARSLAALNESPKLKREIKAQPPLATQKSVQFADQSPSPGIQLHARVLTNQTVRVHPDSLDSGIDSTSAGHKQPVHHKTVRKKHLANAHARLTDTRTKNLMITIKMFVSVTVIFIVSFLPSYLIQYGILPIPRTFAFTYYLNHIANPIIYFILNRTYRERARRLLITITPCLWHPSPSSAAG